MLSFRSILFGAAALATMVSAIPMPDSPLSSVSSGGPLSAVTELLGGGLPTKRGDASLYDKFHDCHDAIVPIIVKIEDAVGCKCDTIDVKLVVGLLGEIVVLLKDLLVDVQAILKVDVILGCTIKELAAIICDLIVIVVDVVVLVLGILGELQPTICEVVALLGKLICDIVTVVLALVAGLLVEVALILKGHVSDCNAAHYTDLLALLGI